MDINTATREELKEYAATLGIKLSMNMGADTMKSRITDAQAQELREEDTGRETTRIIIAKSAGDGGDAPVVLTHNAVHTVIVRGEPVDCPNHLIEILDNAVSNVQSQDDDMNITVRQVQRYPYTRV